MKKLLILLFFLLFSLVSFSQNLCDEDICVVEFNAGFNKANSVDWLDKLGDCGVMRVDIQESPDLQKEYNIVVVPTIIVFNGEEKKRFQANIMMTMEATRKDIQSVIDEILMEAF
jgi:hypothetical protein|tara:strand:- start:21 stop:365 length:345 start_codon:yes stop_codon:yes gene_type:complete